MPRAVPAALLVLALASAPVLTGCGDDDGTVTQGAATTPPATTVPPATPTTPTPTTTSSVPTTPAPGQQDPASPSPPETDEGATTLKAPAPPTTPSAPAVTEVQRPAKAMWCPSAEGPKGTAGKGGRFDARELLGLSTTKAKALAKKNGCSVRVVNRDGQDLIRTMDYSNGRVNVTETKGRVVALDGIG